MITATNSTKPWAVQFTDGIHASSADTTPDKGGGDAGFRPHGLLEAALACCMTMTLSMYAKEKGLPLEKAVVTVTLDRSRRGRAEFRYAAELTGKLSQEDRKLLLAELEHCPVRSTLSSEISFVGCQEHCG